MSNNVLRLPLTMTLILSIDAVNFILFNIIHPDSSDQLRRSQITLYRCGYCQAGSNCEGMLQLLQKEIPNNEVDAEYHQRTLTAIPTCSSHSGTVL